MPSPAGALWGIVPAAGMGARIQPLAFSKELLPVGTVRENGHERPRAVSEFVLERMAAAGADRVCFVIAPGKSDIVRFFGNRAAGLPICYCVQPEPRGLCDAIFQALPILGAADDVLVGMPDSVWFPRDGLARLPAGGLRFLLFDVDAPQLFDAVLLDGGDRIVGMQVKDPAPASRWMWGAFRAEARVLRELQALCLARGGRDEYMGSLVNAWIEQGGAPTGIRAGEVYVDVGTVNGYRDALRLVASEP